MAKDAVFMLRLDSDVRTDVEEHASNMGISPSAWIRDAIGWYLENNPGEIPSVEEIEDMAWDELVDLIEDLGLEIEPDEYDNSAFLSSPDADDTEDLREAVLDELGYTVEADESEEN